jgi:hypothetical protein
MGANTLNNSNFFKNNSNSLITALLVIFGIAFYLIQIIPQNEASQDKKNNEELNNIEVQFRNYLNNKLNEIDINKSQELQKKGWQSVSEVKLLKYENNNNFLNIYREISGKIKIDTSLKTENEANLKTIEDTDNVKVNFETLINRLNGISNFSNYYIGIREDSKGKQSRLELASNVPVQDSDSLSKSNKNQNIFIFKDSQFRYYTRYVKINSQVFILAGGISKETHNETIKEIEPKYLIFFLFITILLFLCINLIKPVFSGSNERLSQNDLVSVTLTIGGIAAIACIYASVIFWNFAFKELAYNESASLNQSINNKLKNKLTFYKYLLDKNEFTREIDTLRNNYSDTLISLLKKDYDNELKNLTKDSLEVLTNNIYQVKSFFRFDTLGFVTADLNADKSIIKRSFSDREYFKKLRKHPQDTSKYLLSAVFGREDNNYQLIFARNEKEKGILGIVYQDSILRPQNGMSFIVLKNNGEILMHSDSKQNLYQNISNLTNDCNKLNNAKASDGEKFTLKYNGKESLAFINKLDFPLEEDLYILTLKDLENVNIISVFTFSNAMIFSLIYALFLFVITFIFSNFMYAGKIGLLSRYHLYYLFPDNSRVGEYKILFKINLLNILINLIFFIIIPLNSSLVLFSICAINIACFNFIFLNCRFENLILEMKKYGLQFLLLGIVFPFILIIKDFILFAIIIIIINCFFALKKAKNWRDKIDIDRFSQLNSGIKPKEYSRFISVIITNQFTIFSFLIASFVFNIKMEKENYSSLFTQEVKDTVSDYSSSKKDEENKLSMSFLRNYQFPQLGLINTQTKNKINTADINNVKPNQDFTIQRYLLNDWEPNFFLLILLFLIAFVTYFSILFYANRFFFFDLMQASFTKYYPFKENGFANNNIIPIMVNNDDILKLRGGDEYTKENQLTENELTESYKRLIKDDNELDSSLKIEFVINQNLLKNDDEYKIIWNRYNAFEKSVLFDFAQDHFVNYKNKDIIMKFMQQGIILTDVLTGRLRMMSLSFKVYIMTMSRRDPDFIVEFEKSGKNGSYSKLKTPIIIIAVGLLMLLMYLNKESYERIFIFTTSLGSAVLLLNRILDFNKKPN